MTDKTETTILLDIYERLGAIETELKNINKNHDDMAAEVKDLKEFKSRVAAYIWLGGSIISGIMFFLWQGLKYGLDRWLPH
jgi:hypothetical protein